MERPSKSSRNSHWFTHKASFWRKGIRPGKLRDLVNRGPVNQGFTVLTLSIWLQDVSMAFPKIILCASTILSSEQSLTLFSLLISEKSVLIPTYVKVSLPTHYPHTGHRTIQLSDISATCRRQSFYSNFTFQFLTHRMQLVSVIWMRRPASSAPTDLPTWFCVSV